MTPSNLPDSSAFKVTGAHGRRFTLSVSPDPYKQLRTGEGLLILGLGPDPEICARRFSDRSVIRYVEAPEFAAQMPPGWKAAIPDHWRQLDPHDTDLLDTLEPEIWFYVPNLRIFPDFWSPILARVERPRILPGPTEGKPRGVWICGGKKELVIMEVCQAFERLGLPVTLFHPRGLEGRLTERLAHERPLFFLASTSWGSTRSAGGFTC